MEPLLERALAIAASKLGVREIGGKNRGPEVERFLANVGLPPGQPWCMAFVACCFGDAAAELGIVNPLPKTGSVLGMWKRSPDTWKRRHPERGAIFVHLVNMADPESHGHCGLVEDFGRSVDGDYLVTLEGNTNAAGSREGDSVLRKRRATEYANCGFILPVPAVGPAKPSPF
jgi:hypothetical protein